MFSETPTRFLTKPSTQDSSVKLFWSVMAGAWFEQQTLEQGAGGKVFQEILHNTHTQDMMAQYKLF